ncbi:hypothetical protein MAR_021498 [Mya arenaria]|uniref:Immunoglobulin I-set domain-containing protein n=1 Tax=Mya arenaria TaxID=6604 RepID=A0ABY7EAJ7_MYAAR|nr:hypothetical protein MAR_021498 [Mya arenaria]
MAVAYPPPMFEWQMWNGTSYNKVYGDKYVITSSDLLTTLTILNIQVDDFGSYILNVSNGIQPNLRELFYLNPQEIRTPNQAAVIGGLVSGSIVMQIQVKTEDGKDGPENLHVYMQLKESNQKSLACYENRNPFTKTRC